MRSVLRLSLPLTLWLASFSAVYGVHGLLCYSRLGGVDGDTAQVLLGLAAGFAILLQVGLLVALQSPRWRDPDRALRRISLGLAVIALASTVWTLLPPVILGPTCGGSASVEHDLSETPWG